MKTLGQLVIMKKVEELGVEEVAHVMQEVARTRGVTWPLIDQEVKRVRAELWKQRYVKTPRAAGH